VSRLKQVLERVQELKQAMNNVRLTNGNGSIRGEVGQT